MNNLNHELCKTCKYRTLLSSAGFAEQGRVACVYITHKHERRGCDWRDCTKYEKGKALRIVSEFDMNIY